MTRIGGMSEALAAPTRPVQGPPAPPAPVPTPVDDQATQDLAGLKKAAPEFESVFLNQLMRAMRATVPENKLFNSGGPTKFYQQMQDAEMAKALAADDGGMGIADLIVRQLAPQQETDGKVAGIAPATPAVDRYRRHSLVSPQDVRMQRLKMKAGLQEAAAADTLRRYEPEFRAAAAESGLPPELLLAVVMEESGGDPGATSSRGARGLMQLMPDTAHEVGVVDPDHPGENLRGGARYLARMLERYEGKLDLALAAYNAGPGNVDRAGRQVPAFRETRRYVERVMARLRGLGLGTDLANVGRAPLKAPESGVEQ